MVHGRKQDLAKVNEAIARAQRELARPGLDPEIRSKLERELEIFEELRHVILLDAN
jgi:hypothetical protein